MNEVQLRRPTSPSSGEIVYGDNRAVAQLFNTSFIERFTGGTGVILHSYQRYINLRHVLGQNYAEGSHYQHTADLGTGAFGTVSKYRDSTSRYEFVIKRIRTAKMSNKTSKDHRSLEREVFSLLDLQHENIIKLIGLVKNECTIDVFLEPWGESLKTHLTRSKRIMPTEEDISLWFLQILFGASYLHTKNAVHCDLHLGNVLLKDGHIRVCDFGSITSIGEQLFTYSHGLTPAYFPPTVLRFYLQEQHIRVTPRLDTYAIGKLLLEVVIGRSNSIISVEEMKPCLVEKSKWDQFVLKQIPDSTGKNIQRVIKGLMSFTTQDGMSMNDAIEILKEQK